MEKSDAATEPNRSEGQRRQVTVLFADIVDFTPLAARLGEENSFHLMQTVSAELMAAANHHKGTVQEFTGDGIMALFGAPLALEDAPLRACAAALEMQERIRALGDKLAETYSARPEIRIGIHCGPLVIGEVGDGQNHRLTAIGDTVNMASRIETAAEPGGIFISASLQALVEGAVETKYVGERVLKGKSKPQKIYRLDGLKSGISRFDIARRHGLTTLIEREKELEILRHHWQHAKANGIRFVHVTGEPGIGKSRLIHEFRQRLSDDNTFVLEGDCHADGTTSPFQPFIEVVRSSFGISAKDGRMAIERKLKDGLEVLQLGSGDELSFIMSLLGQEVNDVTFAGQGADLIGMRTRGILLDMLSQRCRLMPTVMFIEDLHWIDSASESLLRRIVKSDQKLPLLVVLTYRPHYNARWAPNDNVIEVPLKRLSRNGTLELIAERLGAFDVESKLVQLVIDKAEGNPLFAEEIVKYLQDKQGSKETVLPANLQNLVMERVDRLDEGSRAVLKVAAVIGRKFSSSIVGQVHQDDAAFGECLAELERQELIFRVQDTDADYAFKHALVQDAVYSTLMTPQKRAIHADVADCLEQVYADRLEEIADTLAHHYDITDRRDKAVRYLTLAGRKNLQMFSLDAADVRLARAVELMEADLTEFDRASFAELLAIWLEVQEWRAEFGRLVELAEPRLKLVETLGDNRHVACIIALLGAACSHVARFEDSKVYLRKALAIAERCQDDEAIARACLAHMNLYNLRFGDVATDYVANMAERVFPITDRLGNLYFWTYCNFFLAWNHAIRGDLDNAKRLAAASVELGRRENYAGAIGYGLFVIAYIDAFSERFEEAIKNANEGAQSAGGFLDRLCLLATKGLAMILSRQISSGTELLTDVRQQIIERKFLTLSTVVEVPMGMAKVLNGELAGGIRWIDATISRMRDWGNPHAAAIGHLVLGEIFLEMVVGNEKPPIRVILKNLFFLLRTLPLAKAKALRNFEAAIEIGRTAGMNGIVAHAMMDIGLVHKASKRLAEAQSSLEKAQTVAATLDWQFINDKIARELHTIKFG